MKDRVWICRECLEPVPTRKALVDNAGLYCPKCRPLSDAELLLLEQDTAARRALIRTVP